MSADKPKDEKKPPAAPGAAPGAPGAPAADAAAAPPANPAQDVKTRLDSLKGDVEVLNKEVHILEGRLKNRDPAAIAAVERENEALRKRRKNLERALHALLTDALLPRQGSDLEQEIEALRQAAVAYFKNAKIDENLWKDIAS